MPCASWSRRNGYTARSDRKSTRLNSNHGYISYAVFCLKKKNDNRHDEPLAGDCTEVPVTSPTANSVTGLDNRRGIAPDVQEPIRGYADEIVMPHLTADS